MNRKGTTQEQNDISIINGLPQRLQKKIAEGSSSSATTFSVDHIQNGRTTTDYCSSSPTAMPAEECSSAAAAVESARNVPLDFFLRSAKTTSRNDDNKTTESCGEAEATAAPVNSAAQCCETWTDNTAIPGILRLNAMEAAQLTKVGKPNSSSRENGHRRAQARSQRNEITARAVLPRSPVADQPKAAHPPWFDIPYANGLSELYDAWIMQQKSEIENWQTFGEMRSKLQEFFMQLLLHHLKFCCEQKVDTFFWKLLFYNVREYLKSQKSAQALTLSLIDDGLDFYTDLHSKLVAKYLTPIPSEEHHQRHKYEFIAKVSAQKLLICLGDLSRYKTKQLQTNDYTEAAKYYQRAQYLIPTNGIPYNQLAIVAIHARKKFDAIYFHMRSLMSSNAIYSARESLLVLFDEIRKKYEETELKTSPVHHNASKSGTNSKSMRKEVWIYPDGVRRLHRTDINGNKAIASVSEENRFSEMPTEELLRRFTSLYLYVIGKLYTGVGMESIQDHQRKLLIQLNVALKRCPLIITRSRIQKMVALNIFVLQHNMHKDSRREIRYHAFHFFNQMFGLMLRKGNQLFTEYLAEGRAVDDTDKCFTDLNTVLQYIKVYTDWLKQNVDIWEPLRTIEHSFVDCWSELELTSPHLQRIQHSKTNSIANAAHHHQAIVLEEDNFLIGFTPLAATLPKQSLAKCSTEIAQFQARVEQIYNFQHYFEANQKRLALPADSHFVLEDLNSAIKNVLDTLQSDDDENSENIVVNGLNKSTSATELKLANVTNADNVQMTQLSKLKKELEAKSNEKKMYNAKLEEILKFVDSKLYIEVRPKYLLPDTNCFIDCLEDFERLSKEFKRYTLIIPLTVVKELDGLSKGVKLETYEKSLQKHRIHHFDDVSTRAKKSLDFIRTTKNNVKCVTTKGSIINASLFALTEEENVSNDDKILATALALSKTMSSETSKDGKCFIQTELVLITTDRNLRVKALSRNLAVSELSEFLQWAKDCNN